ncbi:hypothetical protein [Accumulibacter sp.]|uniref:hypothetical protein n=1 Tax=Candidatus Accumulibacter TaxID=327159 RepID=UPI0002E9C5FA|nr:hypothetical protein [Accumulibacter sp.]MBN8499158.1 hypothetical protein [Accumulibacter sp.]MBO3714904.1 hypothetical protein [Accumulibacter sp.]
MSPRRTANRQEIEALIVASFALLGSEQLIDRPNCGAVLPSGAVDAFTPCMDAVPALGQHTDAILGELGWDAAVIERLRQAGAT